MDSKKRNAIFNKEKEKNKVFKDFDLIKEKNENNINNKL